MPASASKRRPAAAFRKEDSSSASALVKASAPDDASTGPSRGQFVANVVKEMRDDWAAFVKRTPDWQDNPLSIGWLRPRLLKLRSLCKAMPPPLNATKTSSDLWYDEVFGQLTLASKQCLERLTGYSSRHQGASLETLGLLSFAEHCLARHACELAGSVQPASQRLLSVDGNEEDETPMVAHNYSTSKD